MPVQHRWRSSVVRPGRLPLRFPDRGLCRIVRTLVQQRRLLLDGRSRRPHDDALSPHVKPASSTSPWERWMVGTLDEDGLPTPPHPPCLAPDGEPEQPECERTKLRDRTSLTALVLYHQRPLRPMLALPSPMTSRYCPARPGAEGLPDSRPSRHASRPPTIRHWCPGPL